MNLNEAINTLKKNGYSVKSNIDYETPGDMMSALYHGVYSKFKCSRCTFSDYEEAYIAGDSGKSWSDFIGDITANGRRFNGIESKCLQAAYNDGAKLVNMDIPERAQYIADRISGKIRVSEEDVSDMGSMFQFMYDNLFKHWLDYEDGYDSLFDAFEAGFMGAGSWESKMGKRFTFETPEYLDDAFDAGKKLKSMTKTKRIEYLQELVED